MQGGFGVRFTKLPSMTQILCHYDAIYRNYGGINILSFMTQNPSPLTQISIPVLQTLKQQFLKYQGTPFCFVETSHRSKNYELLNTMTVDVIKRYFNAENHEVLLMPTGAAMPSVYFNNIEPETRAIFYSEGSFSNSHFQEMKKYHLLTHKVNSKEELRNLLETSTENKKMLVHYNKIDDGKEINLQLQKQDKKKILLVKNINYCFPWAQTKIMDEDLVYFDSQTGFSVPGFTVMLLKKEMVQEMKVRENCPDMLDFLLMLKMKSVVNTPFTLCTLVLYHNIKYALENNGKIFQQVKEAKGVHEKSILGFGSKNNPQSQQKNEQSREAFNFIKRSYNLRQEETASKIQEYGWVNKDTKQIFLFIQCENCKPIHLTESITEDQFF